MKKLSLFLMAIMVATVSFTFSSCSKSPDAQSIQFQKDMIRAVEEGDIIAFSDVIKDAVEYEKTLSDEDKKKFDDAKLEGFEEKMEEAMKKLPEDQQMAFGLAMIGAAADAMGETEDLKKELEDVSDELDDALKEMGDELDDELKNLEEEL